jgi:hypothetical protein
VKLFANHHLRTIKKCGALFRTSKERGVETDDSYALYSPPLPGHYYFIGWVPGRSLDTYTVLVFDRTDHKVAHFARFPVESLQRQIKALSQLSRHYNRAVVRAFDSVNGALVTELEMQGVWVERVKLTRSKLKDSYENLALLMEMITIPDYPELQAELDVFTSGPTYDESADYSLQVAQQSGIHALCLVTYDLSAELLNYHRQPSVYYKYDRYVGGDVHFSW